MAEWQGCLFSTTCENWFGRPGSSLADLGKMAWPLRTLRILRILRILNFLTENKTLGSNLKNSCLRNRAESYLSPVRLIDEVAKLAKLAK